MANILVLEDDYHLAKEWREVLRRSGHTVTLCYTSSEAKSQAENEAFDFFVIDLKIDIDLKDVKDSGVRFLSYLQKVISQEEMEIRVIGVSGLLIDSDHRQTRHTFEMFDVTQFLPKPFEPATLVKVIRQQEALLDERSSVD